MLKTILLVLVVAAGCFVSAQERIVLSEKNLINISAKGNTAALIDEQELAGDPYSGTGGEPTTTFTNGYVQANLYYPLQVVVDLFGTYALESFCYYDVNNSDTISVYSGKPGEWKLLFRESTSRYNSWAKHSIADTCRYLLINVHSPGTLISEIVVYGSPIGQLQEPQEPVPVKHKYPLMEDFIGVNGFIDDPLHLTSAVGFVREYHNWQWDEGNGATNYTGYPDNRYGWNPSWVRGSGWGWNFDDYYKSLKETGIGVSPDLQLNVPWLVNGNSDSLNNKPVRAADPLMPQSYSAHADWMFQFTARYGSQQIANGLIKTDEMNAKTSALNYVAWIEDWNEPDKWWKGRSAYFTPFELAAMMSADYDGDQKRMGITVGAKNADPTMKMAMPGLTEMSVDYIKAIKFWAEHFRAGSFPADAINFHHYSNDAGGQNGNATKGISPEQDSLRFKAEVVVNYRNKWLPGKEVWISEFGYDTHQGSPFHAPPIGLMDSATVQGIWIARSYLELAAAGVDKAMLFMLRDDWGTSPGKFASSGLVTGKNGDDIHTPFEKKKSWYYVYTLKRILSGYRFNQDISDNSHNIRIYEFVNDADSGKRVAVIWSPTSSDLKIQNYQFRINADSALVMEVNEADTNMIKRSAAVNSYLNIDVSEKPIFAKYVLSATNAGKKKSDLNTKDLFRLQDVVYCQHMNTMLVDIDTKVNKAISFTVLNLQGKCVFERTLKVSPASKKVRLPFHATPGIYLIRMIDIRDGKCLADQRMVNLLN